MFIMSLGSIRGGRFQLKIFLNMAAVLCNVTNQSARTERQSLLTRFLTLLVDQSQVLGECGGIAVTFALSLLR